ncbi:threonine ammonia-lyase IlvA [Jannaschia aquimarina]|uniref:L-threonine dehydratase n=1 Tax=Jannaschia aquimarina TaxID=935700 RepID=A0A0D1EH66_9RHOB|nr:threonine ammonia-lyase IlvA [Jannaschia aquimarina]KIT17019.1 L-threonine dehydratase biosynthetic IlvA [Jannaschia aquimarina]SNS81607.1 L-threonine ammonia-lyase [Jannaschia aquimarina]
MNDRVAGALAATDAMREVFPATPCLRNDFLSDRYGADIWLKREDLTPVRSYKLRGAFNAMRKLSGEAVACASAGNHAQGVAWMCRHLGVDGTIFMPVTTPGQKIDKTRAFGGEHVRIELTGDFFDATLAAARRFCEETGAHFLSPFDDDDVIEGQASVAVEMLEQMDGPPDMLVMPVGGGGLSAGVVGYLRAARQMPQDVRLVEPVGAASLAAALVSGHPVTLDQIDSFVDGAAVARIGDRPFELLRQTPPQHVLRVPEGRLCLTIQELLNIEGIVLEPAGALSVDALRDLRPEIEGRRVVCVTTGGNFDFERLPDVKERAMRFGGLKKYYILRMPQRPGALRDFLELLGPDDDIARFEYLKKSARNFGTVLMGIETTDPASFERLQARMDDSGFTWRDITGDPVLAELVI